MRNRFIQLMALGLFTVTMLLVASAAAHADPAHPAVPVVVQKELAPLPVAKEDKYLIYIDGPITRASMGPVQSDLMLLIKQKYEGTVTIVINSPGGEVISGMSFVNVMNAAKDAGMTLDCYVLDMAASMAFQIFTQCSNRHSLNTSFLLWHGVRVGGADGAVTSERAQALADELAHMNKLIKGQLYTSLNLSHDTIDRNFLAETFWSGLELNDIDPDFTTAENAYPGLLARLDTAVRTPQGFFSLFGTRPGIAPNHNFELMYQWDRGMEMWLSSHPN